MEIFMNANGWIGVGIGCSMFIMGYLKGWKNSVTRASPMIVEATVNAMIADGYLRVRKVLNSEGMWEEELLKHDEKV